MTALIAAGGSVLTVLVGCSVLIGCVDGWRTACAVFGFAIGALVGAAAIVLFWVWVGFQVAGGAA